MTRHKFARTAKNIADRLTSAQIIRLYQFIDPISAQERAELDKLSDDDLVRQLTGIVTEISSEA